MIIFQYGAGGCRFLVGTKLANILVADQDQTMQDLLNVALQRVDHEVTLVKNGKEALESIRLGNFDLVILDYSLQDLSAIDILQQLRIQDDNIPHTMILSSKGTPDSIRECVEAGAREYVVKPFSLPVLIERISFLLQRGAAK